LRIVQAQVHCGDRCVVAPRGNGQCGANAGQRCAVPLAQRVEQLFRLFLQMGQMRPLRQLFHDNLHALMPKVRKPGCIKVDELYGRQVA
jgi:hypothetical protein